MLAISFATRSTIYGKGDCRIVCVLKSILDMAHLFLSEYRRQVFRSHSLSGAH